MTDLPSLSNTFQGKKPNLVLRFAQWMAKWLFTKKTAGLFKKINEQHPKLSTWCIILTFLLSGIIVFKVIYIYKRHTNQWSELPEAEHIDIAGLLCAVLIFVVACLITMYVEEQRQKQSELLQFTADNTLGLLMSLQPQRTLSERMKALEHIISITKSSELKPNPALRNKLYILNYNAGYGQVQSYNMNVTLIDEPSSTKPKSWRNYHNEFFEKYKRMQDSLFDSLLDLDQKSVNIALLRTKYTDFTNQSDKFERLLNKVLRGNTHHKVYGYSRSSNERFDALDDTTFAGDIYALPLNDDQQKNFKKLDSEGRGQPYLKDLLIDKICKENIRRINDLKQQGIADNIAFLDYVPFQFFLTTPDKPDLESQQECLLIFTNVLGTEAQPTHTVSFVSRNKYLIHTLKDIYTTLTTNYQDKESGRQQLMDLFSCHDTQPIFVLKKISELNHEEKTDLAYHADYTAYSDIKEAFDRHEISVQPILFDDEFTLGETDNRGGTYIVIGLFGNGLADKLSNNLSGDPDIGFKFDRKPIKGPGKGFDFEKIVVDFKQMLGEDGSVSRYTEEVKREEGEELALFAKIFVNESTFIICGGLSGYGTGNIGRYIAKNIEHITKRLKPMDINRKSFAVIFTMPMSSNMSYRNSAVTQGEIDIKKIFK